MRVGIIGYGLAGRLFHAPFIAVTDGLELSHVVTRDPQRAAAAVAEHPGVSVVADVEALLASDVELVVVASPSPLHEAHTRAALAAGKHVVLDKPPAATAARFETLIAAAADAGRHLIVFHNRRWDSDFLTLRDILATGDLGTVHRFETRFERWRPRGKGGWREAADAADMGGLRYDLGPHLVDQALLLFGPVERVQARSVGLRDVGSVDDDVLAMLIHRSGTTTVLSASLLTALPGPRYRVFGTIGAALLTDVDTQEDRLRAGERPGPGWGRQDSVAEVVIEDPPQGRVVDYVAGDWPAFYAGVRDTLADGAPPPVSTESALATMRVLDAIGEAARTETTINVHL